MKTMTTIETVTETQICALRDEASSAGDFARGAEAQS